MTTAAWEPLCMEPEEWVEWQAMNSRAISHEQRSDRPCADCPLGYAADMRAAGRCNGSPGGVEEDEVSDVAERPRLMAVGRELPVALGLPCPRCAHKPVCSIRAVVEARLESLPVQLPILDPAITVVLTAAVTCGHFMKAPNAPKAAVAESATGNRGHYTRTPEHIAKIAEANRRRAAKRRGE